MNQEKLKDLRIALKRAEREFESGRSMVEMLGVLAVIGVLSVAGIAAYSTAMNKHRANELMNEAQKRAVIAQAQLAQGRSADQITFSEFTHNNMGYGTFDTSALAGTTAATFGVKVSGVAEGGCEQLANMSGGNVRVKKQDALASEFTAASCDDSNALAFVFGDDELTNANDSPNVENCNAYSDTSVTGMGGSVPGTGCRCESWIEYWDGTECTTASDDSGSGSGSGVGCGAGSSFSLQAIIINDATTNIAKAKKVLKFFILLVFYYLFLFSECKI